MFEKLRRSSAAPREGQPNGNASRELESKLDRWLGSPAFAAVVTFLVVLAGAAASLFTEGIRQFQLFSWMKIPAGTDLGGAAAFWLLVVLSVILLYVNQRGVAGIAAREQSALKGSLAQLDDAVRRLNTLPTKNFLPAFQDSFREALATALLPLADDTATVSQIEKAIRAVLAAIADTAKDFDGATMDAVYGANIMVFRRRDEPSQVVDALGLVRVGPCHEEYLGALELVPALSTSTAEPGQPDARIKAICLPVPTDGNDYYDSGAKQTKSVLIPGAPTSYVKKTFDAFASIDDFLARLDSSTSIDRRHVGRIQQYFTSGDGKAIKSFASLPIVDITEISAGTQGAEDESTNGRPIAVLNIHSESPGLLEDNGATLFAPLAGPFLNLLAILLSQRDEVRSEASSGTAGTAGGQTIVAQEGAKQ